MRILITGGEGFVASHFVEHILAETDWKIVLLDKFLGMWIRLKELGCLNSDRITILSAKLETPLNPIVLESLGEFDYIVHLGGRTRIADSIEDPASFIQANIVGTCQMLDFARKQKDLKRFIYFSTDEVFGKPKLPVPFTEESPYRPSTPYGASKIGAVEMCLAWWNTYDVPVIVTTCMSLFGERQTRDKFVPQLVRAAMKQTPIQIYADPETSCPSYGDYLHAKDAVSAVMFLLTHGKLGEKYNIARIRPHANLDVLIEVERSMKMPIRYEFVEPEKVRPGFYVRYGLVGTKLFKLGWPQPQDLDRSISKTVSWMLRLENRHWLELE